MTTLVNRVLSQADKVNHYWFKEAETEKENSPRYSLSAPPPPYEKVAQEKKYSFSSIWKRASFSSAYATPAVPEITTGPVIDKQQVEQGISLLNIATDMNRAQSNPTMAFDLYLMGLEKIMAALPLDTDPNAKLALERKLVLLKQAHQLDLKEPQPTEKEQDSEPEKPIRNQLSDLVIHAAVLGAVALKKSPIPDALSGVFNFALDSIQAIDQRHQIRQRTWSLATFGFSKAVEIDKQFEIHQLVTEAIYTGFSAFVKAGLAYSEAPGYQKR